MNQEEPNVSDVHPELHHYTNWSGLEGIVKSRTLWATHFSQLNDYTEITHLEEHLADAVSKKLEEYANFKCLTDSDFRHRMVQLGDIRAASKHDAKSAVESLYDVTFRGRILNPKKKIEPFVEPFITSFCSHGKDSEYERGNGLLSQWNRYGREEGYAIVFDAKQLEERIRSEKNTYGYYFIGFYDVVYNDSNFAFEREFSLEIDEVFKVTHDFIFDIENVNPIKIFEPLVRAATRFKHQAFKEEREVRIVICPATHRFEEYIKNENPDLYEERTDEFQSIFPTPKIHLCMFDSDVSRPLPIKRIIVGPHKCQKHLINKVEKLLGDEVAIVCSETPYRSE